VLKERAEWLQFGNRRNATNFKEVQNASHLKGRHGLVGAELCAAIAVVVGVS
jgi:hypothetical protein